MHLAHITSLLSKDNTSRIGGMASEENAMAGWLTQENHVGMLRKICYTRINAHNFSLHMLIQELFSV